ncbi:MarR family transcriptional regulator [Methylobacterium sp. ARG-1]|uniref:MarR family winged helix-turn-helix transcriptional regulator n=1 Tax=Methylobacterium sp. ARG-1 TaxID=1692501 RepID=UPI000B0F7E20|nr:MarR family transcriptional regulator [Methylobacterium sp. ARG-1]
MQQGQFDVLATLRRSGAPYALTPTALCEAAMISSGGMTARIDRFEKAALIERQKHPSDRRGTLVALAQKGSEVIDALLPRHIEGERRVLAPLTKDEQRILNRLLAKLIAGLG